MNSEKRLVLACEILARGGGGGGHGGGHSSGRVSGFAPSNFRHSVALPPTRKGGSKTHYTSGSGSRWFGYAGSWPYSIVYEGDYYFTKCSLVQAIEALTKKGFNVEHKTASMCLLKKGNKSIIVRKTSGGCKIMPQVSGYHTM